MRDGFGVGFLEAFAHREHLPAGLVPGGRERVCWPGEVAASSNLFPYVEHGFEPCPAAVVHFVPEHRVTWEVLRKVLAVDLFVRHLHLQEGYIGWILYVVPRTPHG